MKTIRRFAFASLLTLSALSLLPSVASAQSVHGKFSLAHEVHWQHAVIPAGEYRFDLAAQGASSMLTLSKLSGGRTGYMLLVSASTPAPSSSEASRLVLVSRATGSFVSSMELPEYGMTLNFVVPEGTPATAIAGTNTASASSPTR